MVSIFEGVWRADIVAALGGGGQLREMDLTHLFEVARLHRRHFSDGRRSGVPIFMEPQWFLRSDLHVTRAC